MHNSLQLNRLVELAQVGSIPHALLLCGPQGSGRMALAQRVASLYCLGVDDPDAILRSPMCTVVEGTGVEQIRMLREELSKQAFHEGNRVVLIKDAHLLTQQAQNALLKTLEDPPQRTTFILTGIAAGLLATIRSRCTIIRLGTTSVEQIERELIQSGIDPQSSRIYAAVSCGVPGNAHKLAKSPELQQIRKDAITFVERMLAGNPAFDLVGSLVLAGEDRIGFSLECMQSFLGDVERLQTGVDALENPDYQRAIRSTAQSFTIGRIQGMIRQLIEASERRAVGINAAAVMDYLVAGWMDRS